MIELNKKTQQDFLNREWVQKLLDAGVNMSDAKYRIYNGFDGKDYITLETQLISCTTANNIIPTYTVSELLYKLHERIYPIIDNKKYSGGLSFLKDAPFYIWYYNLKNKFTEEGESIDHYIHAEAEYPIESLASVLIQCHQKEIGMNTKDVGDISGK